MRIIYSHFYPCDNQPLKQRLNKKRHIILNTYLTFSHSLSVRNIFCFIKYIIFFSIIKPISFSDKHSHRTKRRLRGIQFYEVFYLLNILTVRWITRRKPNWNYFNGSWNRTGYMVWSQKENFALLISNPS